MTNGVYLLLGSNLGDRMVNMATAMDYIEKEAGTILAQSQLYETEAWGVSAQAPFLNQVIEIGSRLTAHALLESILEIEKKMGRERVIKWGERLIDIDILYYGSTLVDEPDLQIPHPFIPQRRFTLVPLCEIAPLLLHPVLKKNQLELLKDCTDKLQVKVFRAEK